MALIFVFILFALFYVFLIMPKQRELKRHNALVASLEVGDEVMTGSGFYGTITEIDTDIVRVELAPGLEVKLARRAVAAKVPDPAGDQSAALAAAPVDPDEDEPLVEDDEVDDVEVVDEVDLTDDHDHDLTDDGTGDGGPDHPEGGR